MLKTLKDALTSLSIDELILSFILLVLFIVNLYFFLEDRSYSHLVYALSIIAVLLVNLLTIYRINKAN